MTKRIDVGVEHDHIESLTRSNGINAIAELIWNALDADASMIHIDFKRTSLGGYEWIKVTDNGHGLNYQKAQEVFGRIGGSEKKLKRLSPKGRHYHGKEGKGRYKSLALGNLVEFKSIFQKNGELAEFSMKLDRNQLSYTEISDLKTQKKSKEGTGFEVFINNVIDKTANNALDKKNRRELEEKFASYWISYPNFKVFFNRSPLEFDSLIRNSEVTSIPIKSEERTWDFHIKVIEWNFDNKRKTYLCNEMGIPFADTSLRCV